MGELELENLTKVFEGDGSDIVAVEDLNITVNDGEFLVLVGPSGCGKSTTLRCIAGLDTPTTGDIKLDGSSIKDKPSSDRDIAMVFQNYALYPHMTAAENMGFGLKMTTDLSTQEIDDKVRDVAELMGITELLEKKPSELSGGQQQRVALGRAIVRDPEVFLLDEPLSNLDAKLRSQMRTELQNLQQQLDVTTVYVTHDQTEAMTMGDKIAVLNDGELQQLGTPLECYHEPANRFVAGFIGSPNMNFLDVDFTGTTLRHDAFEYQLTDDIQRLIEPDTDELVLGIRPEDIEIVTGEQPNSVAVRVDVVEPMGDMTLLYVTLDGKQLTVSARGDVIVDTDQEIKIHFPEDCLHLFNRETDKAVLNSRDRGSTISEILQS